LKMNFDSIMPRRYQSEDSYGKFIFLGRFPERTVHSASEKCLAIVRSLRTRPTMLHWPR
jgi:hypothetical protein